MIDIIVEDKLAMIFNGSWQSNLFIIEVLISTVIPAVLFAVPKLSKNSKVQWTGSIMVIAGVVLNRIDVGGLAMLGATGDSYTPMWTEIFISLGIISAAALVFLFAIEHFNVWDIQPKEPDALPHTLPTFDYSSKVWLGTPDVSSSTTHSLAFVLSFAVGMFLMPGSRLHSKGIDKITVSRATGIDTLIINGNKDDQFVKFPHQAHISWIRTQSSMFGKDSCAVCHHLSLPGAKLNGCWECHSSMYTKVDFFNHNWHTSSSGANLNCKDCHKPGLTRSSQSAKKCTNCHPAYNFAGNNSMISKLENTISPGKLSSANNYYILSYTDAMHNLCVSCHITESKKLKDKPHLAECTTCHKTQLPENLTPGLTWKINIPHFNNVILPDVK